MKLFLGGAKCELLVKPWSIGGGPNMKFWSKLQVFEHAPQRNIKMPTKLHIKFHYWGGPFDSLAPPIRVWGGPWPLGPPPRYATEFRDLVL